MGKKKIAFVSQNVAPFRLQWIEALAEEFDITFFHLGEYDKSMNPHYLDSLRSTVSCVNIGKKFLQFHVFKVQEILQLKPDMILLDGYGFFGQLALITELNLRKIPFYMTVDGGFIPETEKPLKRKIKELCLRSARGIFSTSEITDGFINHYTNGSVQIYRHYFSSVYSQNVISYDEEIKRKYKKKFGLEDKFTAICVGRFLPIKGFDIVLKAAQQAEPEMHFLFVGGTPTEEYAELVRKLPAGLVEFIDFISPEALREYYLAADVFLMPSRGDVWGLVVGEAMAMGLPVISSDRCIAAASMVRNGVNGYIIKQEDPKLYSSAMLELKSNPELWRAMSQNNLAEIMKYTVDISAKHDIDTICALLNQNMEKNG